MWTSIKSRRTKQRRRFVFSVYFNQAEVPVLEYSLEQVWQDEQYLASALKAGQVIWTRGLLRKGEEENSRGHWEMYRHRVAFGWILFLIQNSKLGQNDWKPKTRVISRPICKSLQSSVSEPSLLWSAPAFCCSCNLQKYLPVKFNFFRSL